MHHRCQWHRWQICHRGPWHRWQNCRQYQRHRRQICHQFRLCCWHRCVIYTGGKRCQRRRWQLATGINDTGGARWTANISANFRKNSKRLGGNLFMKKTRGRKSRRTVPLKRYQYLRSMHLDCSSTCWTKCEAAWASSEGGPGLN